MAMAMRFWGRLALWGGALTLLVAGVSLAGGRDAGAVATYLPRWTGFSLIIAAFPAGIAVWKPALRDGSWIAGLGRLTGAAGALSVLAFVLSGWVGPMAAQARGVQPTGQGAAAMTTPELMRAVGEAFDRVSALDDPALTDWQLANDLDWQAQVRFTGPLLLMVLAWLGALTGFWTEALGRPELRGLLRWGAGVFLLMTVYLFGENAYELIAIRLHGPAPFPAFLTLAVPGPLLLGILIPTLIVLRAGQRGAGPILSDMESAEP